MAILGHGTLYAHLSTMSQPHQSFKPVDVLPTLLTRAQTSQPRPPRQQTNPLSAPQANLEPPSARTAAFVPHADSGSSGTTSAGFRPTLKQRRQRIGINRSALYKDVSRPASEETLHLLKSSHEFLSPFLQLLYIPSSQRDLITTL